MVKVCKHSVVDTSTIYTLSIVLPQTATRAPSENTHCFAYRRVEVKVRDFVGELDGSSYTSKFVVVRLLTRRVLSSAEIAALPLERKYSGH